MREREIYCLERFVNIFKVTNKGKKGIQAGALFRFPSSVNPGKQFRRIAETTTKQEMKQTTINGSAGAEGGGR